MDIKTEILTLREQLERYNKAITKMTTPLSLMRPMMRPWNGFINWRQNTRNTPPAAPPPNM